MRERSQLNRQVEPGAITIATFAVDEVGNDPLGCGCAQAQPGMKLLMHTDEVVLWGRYDNGGFQFPPQDLYAHRVVRPFTIQSIRLFDENQETYLWQIAENQWQARTVIDVTDDLENAIEKEPAISRRLDEEQVLWGTQVEAHANGFCRVSDGLQGLVHAPPLDLQPQKWGEQDTDLQRDLRLQIRHYLKEEDATTGWLRIVFSRLVDVYQVGGLSVGSASDRQSATAVAKAQEPRGEA